VGAGSGEQGAGQSQFLLEQPAALPGELAIAGDVIASMAAAR